MRLNVYAVDYRIRQPERVIDEEFDIREPGPISGTKSELIAASSQDEAVGIAQEQFPGPEGTSFEIEHVRTAITNVFFDVPDKTAPVNVSDDANRAPEPGTKTLADAKPQTDKVQ